MIFINKSRTPVIFSDIKRKYHDYDELHEEDKIMMKSILLQEQGNICAYCMTRIQADTSTIEHYIPRHGQNGDMSLSLEYRNLFAVCRRTRGEKAKNKTCDDRKGDRLISINPSRDSDIEQIRYKTDGTIYSDNASFNQDLDNTLNLNDATLKSNRKAAVDAVLLQLSKRKKGSWNKEYIQKVLDTYQSANPKTEYVGIIIYRLQKKLRQF